MQTYRRFKDLQANKKPEPFIITELASDMSRDQKAKRVNKPIPPAKQAPKPVKP
jgi:hypothetical protein